LAGGERMKKRILILLFIAQGVIASVCWASSGKILFDDFSSGYLHKAKWWPREYVLELLDGEAVFKLGNSNGMGAEIRPGLFNIPLTFFDPNAVDAIECAVTIVETVIDFPEAYSAARIGGYFYNENSAGGRTGDIFAHIMIADRGNGGLEAQWSAHRVIDENGILEFIEGETLVTPIQYNVPVIVKISYDGQRTITFSVNDQTDVFQGPERKRPPVTLDKGLAATISTPNSQEQGFVSAKFDNVRINKETFLYDDFSSSSIDLSRWREVEFVREASNDYLRANVRGFGRNSQCNTALSQADAPYIEAKVRIDGGSQLSPGAWGTARIQGYYYNESRGPGSGQDYNAYEGNVFAQMALQYFSDGTLRAYASVARSNDAIESSFTGLFEHQFSTQILLDTDYILSIMFEDNRLTFSFGGENKTYHIQSRIYPAYREHRHLRSRVILTSGQSGYIRTAFDEVYVGFPKGDINFDKEVSLFDAILALQVAAGIPPAEQIFIEADLSSDNKIGLEEVLFIMQKLSTLR
jgi:hypothetical protein